MSEATETTEIAETPETEDTPKPNGDGAKLGSLYQVYALRPDVIETGVLLKVEGTAAKVMVRPASYDYNPEFRDAMSAFMQKCNAEGIEPNWYDTMMATAYTCIVSWEGVRDAEDNNIKFSKENAQMVCQDVPAFARMVYDKANEIGEFNYQLDSDSAKS